MLVGGWSPIFPFTRFSVHLAISTITPAGSVYKSSGDNVGAGQDMTCVVYVSVTKRA